MCKVAATIWTKTDTKRSAFRWRLSVTLDGRTRHQWQSNKQNKHHAPAALFSDNVLAWVAPTFSSHSLWKRLGQLTHTKTLEKQCCWHMCIWQQWLPSKNHHWNKASVDLLFSISFSVIGQAGLPTRKVFFKILSDLNQAVPTHLADESQTR